MNIKHYSYRVTWSPEYSEHVGLCAEFSVGVPPLVHRNLALLAAEEGGSLNRLASAKVSA
jgi:hypothetical protein